MRVKPLVRVRDEVIHQLVKDEVARYLEFALTGRHPVRHCAYCGKKFQPRMRWHFFDVPTCRMLWYAGQFKPRAKD